jgi:putative restriction endonuclease
MKIKNLKNSIENLTVWKKGNQRAPHKPLLILYALGQLHTESSRLIPYEQIREHLKTLLIEFGPIRNSYHPEEPFVRLKNDGIWELNTEVDHRKFSDKQLLTNDVSGGFSEEVYITLLQNKESILEIANIILENHFPESIHDDILEAVGLDFSFYKKRKRDPKFREKILRAYGYSCAVCGFNIRLSNTLVGIEAAHIKWYQAGGPDEEENGIALCSLHHKLFDRGVFTISNSSQMIVSQDANGTGLNHWLMPYHGKVISEPIQLIYQPNEVFLNWHVKEVFRGPGRYAVGY